MEKTYIFKTKDGTKEFTVRGSGGMKRREVLKKKNPNIKINAGSMVTTIITDFEDVATLEKEVMC